jgi:predicted ArsR family transcriptional regulator
MITSHDLVDDPPQSYIVPPKTEERIRFLFADRLTITLAEVAAILRVEVKTVRALCNTGQLGCVTLGVGRSRPRRRFTSEHVLAFLHRPTTVGKPEASAIEADRVRAAVRRRVAAYRSAG